MMISKFWKEYKFLSNFFPINIKFNGINFLSVEHAYQAAKSKDKEFHILVSKTQNPGKVKRLGRKVTLRDNWDILKVSFMTAFLLQKFSNKSLMEKLLATKPHILVEGNDWGDSFWGVAKNPDGTFSGKNILGALLMEIRDERIFF